MSGNTLKRSALAALSSGVLLISAMDAWAGDLSAKAGTHNVAPTAPAYNWSGFYVGGHVGYGWGGGNSTGFAPLPDPVVFGSFRPETLSSDLEAGFGGGQIGINWHFAQRWVAGAEVDYSKSNLDGSAINNAISSNAGVAVPGAFISTSQSINWFGTVRGRLGYLPVENLLLYVTGGLAHGSVDYAATLDYRPAGPNAHFPASVSRNKTGWVAGTGAEWAFSRDWSAKVEYLYYDLGDESATVERLPIPLAPFLMRYDWETKFQTVRFGLNYKFGAPIVANSY